MKRLNHRQQNHLNNKFADLCERFMQQQRDALMTYSSSLKPITVTATVSLTPNRFGGYASDVHTVKLPPPYVKLQAMQDAVAKDQAAVVQLKADFEERLLFYADEFDTIMAVLHAYEEKLK